MCIQVYCLSACYIFVCWQNFLILLVFNSYIELSQNLFLLVKVLFVNYYFLDLRWPNKIWKNVLKCQSYFENRCTQDWILFSIIYDISKDFYCPLSEAHYSTVSKVKKSRSLLRILGWETGLTACLLRESRRNGGLPHLSGKPVLICLYQGAAVEGRQGRIGLNDGLMGVESGLLRGKCTKELHIRGLEWWRLCGFGSLGGCGVERVN